MTGIPPFSSSHDARRLSARCAFALLAAVVFLFTSAAHAGRYELAKFWYTGIHSNTAGVHKSDVPLCKAFVQNLNSFPERKEPMVCERPLHSKFKDFSRPEWKRLDPRKHIKLFEQIARQEPYYRSQSKEILDDYVKRFMEEINEKIAASELTLNLARLDLVGPASRPDGKPENVLRVEFAPCNPDSIRQNAEYRRRVAYYIANDDLTEVRAEFARSIRGLDPFLYHGKVYFDGFTVSNMPDPDLDPKQRAAGVGIDQYEVYIYRPIEDGVARFCRIRYID